ncbi:DUF2867 domain-containing protein [Streptomyces sp. NPDC059193]|uniref:DUF2867 domain-containing protein n=1 Tax=Streptomyces sp. NPDC059193 TaxID=3346763 RepID=UPI0036B72A51
MAVDMRLPEADHTGQPWRIHEMVDDFVLADVWAIPSPGGPDDLARLARVIAYGDESFMSNPFVRALFAIRMKLGAWFGWDPAAQAAGPGGWSLRERLPDDLRSGRRGPDVIAPGPFPSVYLTDTEWVAECSSRSVQMVQHVGWLPDGSDGYRGQLAVLVRPKNRFGRIYMRGIMPFRRLIVVPALVRSIGRDWERAQRAEHHYAETESGR